MQRHRSPWPAVAALMAAAAVRLAGAADEPRVVVLVERGPPVAELACPANGQVVFCLDAESGGVTAVDPGGSPKPRLVVGPPAKDGPRPQAIACIETNTLAAVCRAGAEWSLRTWRLRPDEAVPAAEPLQELPLGEADAAPGRLHLLVGHSRDWLAVSGLPAPLPPLVRGAIARASVGRLSDRGCPPPSAAGPAVAVAADAFDELVRFTSRTGEATGGAIAFHDLSGRTLLELACDLPQIRDAACCRADGTLWVVAGDRAVADRPEGLWRIDAVLENGRQVVRPVCVARLAGPRAVACIGSSAVVVAHGDAGRTLVRLDLVTRKAAAPAVNDEKETP
jgi:hypothetical protein